MYIVSDFAIMRNMRTCHKISVTTNGCYPILFFRTTINSNALSKYISVTYYHLSRTPLVAYILWFCTNHDARKKSIVFTNDCVPGYRYIAVKDRAGTYLGIRADTAKRTDTYTLAEYGMGMNVCEL